MDIAKIRRDFGLRDDFVYFNSAVASYPPESVMNSVFDKMKNFKFLSENGYFRKKNEIYEEFLNVSSEFLSCEKDEITGISCTSLGTNYIASGLNFKENDNILINNYEFVSLFQPFFYQAKKKNLKIKVLDLNSPDFSIWNYERLIDRNTKLIALSQVEYSNGYRFDQDEISKFKSKYPDILIFVDAIQSLGAFRTDVKRCKVDFLSAGSSKWLSGFHGYGLFYVKKDLIDRINLPFSFYPGLKNLETAEKDFRKGANPKFYVTDDFSMNKFQMSTENLPGKICLTEMIKYFIRFGLQNIEERILDLSSYLTDELLKKGYKIKSPVKKENMSGIVSFVPSTSQEKFVDYLAKRNIFISYRYGSIRVSLHFFNTGDEIKKFLHYV